MKHLLKLMDLSGKEIMELLDLADHRSGDTVRLTVSRDGRQLEVSLTLDEYEPSDPRTSYSNVYDV